MNKFLLFYEHIHIIRYNPHFFWREGFNFMVIEKENLILNYLNEEIEDVPNLIHNYLNDGSIVNYRSEFEDIKAYIDNYLDGYSGGRFLVLPGIRGVGKTILLYQTYNYLIKEKNIPPSRVLYISFDEIYKIVETDIKEVVDVYLKYKHDTKLSLVDEKIFILIDESQYEDNWALSGKIIFDKTKNVFAIFTGSSALDLENNPDAVRRMDKQRINPLNYGEHLRLRYNIQTDGMSELMEKVVFEGDVLDAMDKEEQIYNQLMSTFNYPSNDWDTYLKYGGYPILFEESNYLKLRKKLVEMINRVVSKDMVRFKNISEDNRTNAQRVLRRLSLQKSNETSQNKLANELKTSSANIHTILGILEKTHIIFHCENFTNTSDRSSKNWKYYFATSSLKYALSSQIGNPEKNTPEFEGVLLENLVASTLSNTYLNREEFFTLYYDAHKKGNVDFIVDNEVKNPIPIEVGRGKKDRKQIKNAIDSYNADYGIVISNNTNNIEKKNDIIYIPYRTFSFL